MEIELPSPSLIVLVGPAGSGKTTFARRVFRPTEILSSDELRAMIADDETDQGATGEAWSILDRLTAARLRRRLLTVIDATNVVRAVRRRFVVMARRAGVPAIAVVFDVGEEVAQAWNAARPGRTVPPSVVSYQHALLAAGRAGLVEEGFSRVLVFRDPAALRAASVTRRPFVAPSSSTLAPTSPRT